jgi:hypothetical protein
MIIKRARKLDNPLAFKRNSSVDWNKYYLLRPYASILVAIPEIEFARILGRK